MRTWANNTTLYEFAWFWSFLMSARILNRSTGPGFIEITEMFPAVYQVLKYEQHTCFNPHVEIKLLKANSNGYLV